MPDINTLTNSHIRGRYGNNYPTLETQSKYSWINNEICLFYKQTEQKSNSALLF